MANNDVSVKVSMDTGNFRSQMSQMKKDLKSAEQDWKLLDKELQQNGSKVDQLSGKYNSLESRLKMQSNITDAYRAKVSQLMQTLEKNRNTLESAAKAYEEGKKQYSENSSELNKLKTSYEKAAKSVATAEKSYQNYQKQLDSSAKKEQFLRSELKLTATDLQKQSTYIARVNASYEKMQKDTEKLRKGLSTAGSALTRGVTVPLLAAGAAAVKYASDVEEAQNKVTVSFGDSAGVITEFAETTNEMYGIAKGTALDMAALYGDMATSMGIPQEQAAEMAKTLVGLGGDLASFKNIGLDQVSTGLKGIFSGETESLKELAL